MRMVLFCFVNVLFIACVSNKSISSGYIEKERLFWHQLKKEFVPDDWTPVSRYIYKDSFIIYRRNMIMNHEDAFGNKRSWLQLMYYCFADLRNDTYYEFDSLKMNARCLRKYRHMNSNDSTRVGLNYYEEITSQFIPPEYDNAVRTDTTLEGIKHTLYTLSINFKREQPDGSFKIDSLPTTLRWYYRHDLQAPLLRLNREADRRRKATLVKFDMQPDFRYKGNIAYGTNHLKYYPKELTPAEDSVFNAWAKYAAEHPIRE